MVIKGTVHNGQIQIENSILPEGTQVLITPIRSADVVREPDFDLGSLKIAIDRIASLEDENTRDDDFSGADHDKILYGN